MLTPSWAFAPLSAPAYAIVTPLQVALPSPAGLAALGGTGSSETTGRLTGPVEPVPPPDEVALFFAAHALNASDRTATAVTARANRAADTHYLQVTTNRHDGGMPARAWLGQQSCRRLGQQGSRHNAGEQAETAIRIHIVTVIQGNNRRMG